MKTGGLERYRLFFGSRGNRGEVPQIVIFAAVGNGFHVLSISPAGNAHICNLAFSGKKYEFAYMEPYAAIIGQQGHKSKLGEYRAKDFKEALGKDISGAVIYTIADALKLKAFRRQKYPCVNLAGRAFTTYLDDVPAKMMWADGRVAEVYKEDKLYTVLNEITTPGVEYISALVIKASEVFCFYGDGVQIADVSSEYERLKQTWYPVPYAVYSTCVLFCFTP